MPSSVWHLRLIVLFASSVHLISALGTLFPTSTTTRASRHASANLTYSVPSGSQSVYTTPLAGANHSSEVTQSNLSLQTTDPAALFSTTAASATGTANTSIPTTAKAAFTNPTTTGLFAPNQSNSFNVPDEFASVTDIANIASEVSFNFHYYPAASSTFCSLSKLAEYASVYAQNPLTTSLFDVNHVDSNCCGPCYVAGLTAELHYWATPVANNASTQVVQGVVLNSPSPYVAIHSAFGKDRCGVSYGTGVVSKTFAVRPSALSSFNPVPNTFVAINYQDFNQCANYTAPADSGVFVNNVCNPVLNIPDEMVALQPAWSTCVGWIGGIFDPPSALTPQAILASPTPSKTAPKEAAEPQHAAPAPATPTPTPAASPKESPSSPVPSPVQVSPQIFSSLVLTPAVAEAPAASVAVGQVNSNSNADQNLSVNQSAGFVPTADGIDSVPTDAADTMLGEPAGVVPEAVPVSSSKSSPKGGPGEGSIALSLASSVATSSIIPGFIPGFVPGVTGADTPGLDLTSSDADNAGSTGSVLGEAEGLFPQDSLPLGNSSPSISDLGSAGGGSGVVAPGPNVPGATGPDGISSKSASALSGATGIQVPSLVSGSGDSTFLSPGMVSPSTAITISGHTLSEAPGSAPSAVVVDGSTVVFGGAITEGSTTARVNSQGDVVVGSEILSQFEPFPEATGTATSGEAVSGFTDTTGTAKNNPNVQTGTAGLSAVMQDAGTAATSSAGSSNESSTGKENSASRTGGYGNGKACLVAAGAWAWVGVWAWF